jgi:hypothetical protein
MTPLLLSLVVVASPFAGTFQGEGVALSLSQRGAVVSGELRGEDGLGRLRARADGDVAEGEISFGAERMSARIERRGDAIRILVGGDEVELRASRPGGRRSEGPAAPVMAPSAALWSPPARPASSDRRLLINGAAVTGRRLALLERLEASARLRLPAGAYWYDARTGAFGQWGGPTTAFTSAGLDLGPPVPANASGGGTGVFINGRELHPIDVEGLRRLIGVVLPGRYLVDAMGNGYLENGAYLGNLFAVARQRGGASGGGAGSWGQMYGTGSSSFSVVGDGNFMGACTGSGDCAYIGN